MSEHTNVATLDDALDAHRTGDLAHAAALYQEILESDPINADALHLLGVIAHQRGDHVDAIGLIRRAIQARPGTAIFHSNLGEALRANGQLEAAISEYKIAISIKPAFADAHGNLGAALRTAGRAVEAIESFRQAVRLDPDSLDTQMNLGITLREQRQLEEAAECFRRAVNAQPDFAEAHVNLGNVLKELGRFEQAGGHYREALRIRPTLVLAHHNLANLLAEKEEFITARQHYHAAFKLMHGSPLWNAKCLTDTASAQGGSRAIETTSFELLNCAEHVEYLVEAGKIDQSFLDIARRYRSLLSEIDQAAGVNATITLTPAQSARIAGFHQKVIRYADARCVPDCAVNENLDFPHIEDQYLASPVAVIHFDNFLSPSALRGLRDFCLESTIFFGRDRAGTLQSYVGAGFDCTLLFQIVEELKRRFPRVLGNQVLRNMWVYRYASEGEGVNLHTDNASVTFNFWITEDEGNLDSEGSGLIVYAKEQPLDWNWTRYNRDKDQPEVLKEIRDFLSSANTVRIPYRENRAVLFHSNLYHQSDRPRFREGYRNRRMNVTLLFGDRGHDIRLKYLDT
jgi:tetratricopeptide (TPR) repeat protein